MFRTGSLTEKKQQETLPKSSESFFIEENMFIFNNNDQSKNINDGFSNYDDDNFDCTSLELDRKRKTDNESEKENNHLLNCILENLEKNEDLNSSFCESNSDNTSLINFNNENLYKKQTPKNYDKVSESFSPDNVFNKELKSHSLTFATEQLNIEAIITIEKDQFKKINQPTVSTHEKLDDQNYQSFDEKRSGTSFEERLMNLHFY